MLIGPVTSVIMIVQTFYQSCLDLVGPTGSARTIIGGANIHICAFRPNNIFCGICLVGTSSPFADPLSFSLLLCNTVMSRLLYC